MKITFSFTHSLRDRVLASMLGACLLGAVAQWLWVALVSALGVGATPTNAMLVLTLVTFVISRRFAKQLVLPLEVLTKEVKKITGDPSRAASLPIQTTQEGQLLAKQINAMRLDLIHSNRLLEAKITLNTQVLNLSEFRLNQVKNATAAGFWDWFLDENSVRIDARCCKCLSLDPQAFGFRSETFLSSVLPNEREDVRAAVRMCLKSSTPFDLEVKLFRSDGQVVWVKVSGAVVDRNSQGRVTRMAGSLIDVSAQHVVQEVLTDRNEELNTILELSSDGFVLLDNTWHVKFVSPAFSRMTGIDATQVQGLDVTAFWRRFGLCCDPNAAVINLASVPEKSQPGESNARLLANLMMPVQRVVAITRQSQQSWQKPLILNFRDVSHETEVARLKNKFLSAAAYELRTPLASIFGFSEIMLNKDLDDKFRKEFLGIIYRQSHAMSLMLNDLLDMSRVKDIAANDPIVGNLSARELVNQVVDSFELPPDRQAPVINAKAVKLLMNADANKVRRAVFAMLSHAYKYSPDGGEVRIDIEHAFKGEGPPMVAIRITDNGIGMTPEQTGFIFEPLQALQQVGHTPEENFGLSIVKDIAELHGGSATVQSTLGQGTCVSLLLPGMYHERTTAPAFTKFA